MQKQLRTLALAGLIALVGCGGDSSSPTGTPGPGTTTGGGNSTTSAITVRNNIFEPGSTTVTPGTTVTWTWAADADLHNVSFSDGQHSSDQRSGSYARTFGTPGTFSYNCTLHAGMTGTITVR